MPIEFRCVQCQKLLRVADEAAGKKARCPDCGTIQEARGIAGGSLTGFSPAGDLTNSPAQIQPPFQQPIQQPFQQRPASNPFAEQTATGSPFGHATNPYVAPQTPGSPLSMSREMVESKVRGPAIGMLVVSGLMGAIQLVGGITMVFVAANGRGRIEDFAVNIFGLVVGVAISAMIAIGAIKMQRLQSYGLAMTAAILSVLPCSSGCCLIGIPFGVWALVVLSDAQVKASFR